MAKKKGNKIEGIFLIALIVILLVCFAVVGFIFYKFFYAGAGKTKYGDRLNGIENYPINSTFEKDINAFYKEDSVIDKVKVTVEGKIIYLNYSFNENLPGTKARELADKVITLIDEKTLSFYDVQFLLTYSGKLSVNEETNETEASDFPMFGSCRTGSKKVVW